MEKRDSHKPLKDNKKDRRDAAYPKRDQDEESVLSWISAYGKKWKDKLGNLHFIDSETGMEVVRKGTPEMRVTVYKLKGENRWYPECHCMNPSSYINSSIAKNHVIDCIEANVKNKCIKTRSQKTSRKKKMKSKYICSIKGRMKFRDFLWTKTAIIHPISKVKEKISKVLI